MKLFPFDIFVRNIQIGKIDEIAFGNKKIIWIFSLKEKRERRFIFQAFLSRKVAQMKINHVNFNGIREYNN